MALKNSGYLDQTLDVCNRRNNRARKISWYMPPYNMAIANKLGKEFFRLLKKNFHPLSNLYKMSNKNNVRLSHSCMPNVANLIKINNIKKILGISSMLSPLNAIVSLKPIAPTR